MQQEYDYYTKAGRQNDIFAVIMCVICESCYYSREYYSPNARSGERKALRALKALIKSSKP